MTESLSASLFCGIYYYQLILATLFLPVVPVSVFPGVCSRGLGGEGIGKTNEFDNILGPSPPVGKTLLELNIIIEIATKLVKKQLVQPKIRYVHFASRVIFCS